MGISGIYQIRNLTNGKIYVGSTTEGFEVRWRKHRRNLKNRRHHNKHLQSAWHKYGEENFVFEILEKISSEGQTPEEFNELVRLKETEIIQETGCFDRKIGYNISKVGSGGSGSPSEETREKISKSLIGKFAGDKNPMYGVLLVGDKNPMYGKHHTEETKKKISEINKGRERTEEHKKRLSVLGSGEGNPNASLNWEKVNEIRRLSESGEFSRKQLAEMFGVKALCIYRIVTFRSWKKPLD